MGVPADPRELEKLAQAGFTRAIHFLPSVPLSQLEPTLAVWERAIADFIGD